MNAQWEYEKSIWDADNRCIWQPNISDAYKKIGLADIHTNSIWFFDRTGPNIAFKGAVSLRSVEDVNTVLCFFEESPIQSYEDACDFWSDVLVLIREGYTGYHLTQALMLWENKMVGNDL